MASSIHISAAGIKNQVETLDTPQGSKTLVHDAHIGDLDLVHNVSHRGTATELLEFHQSGKDVMFIHGRQIL